MVKKEKQSVSSETDRNTFRFSEDGKTVVIPDGTKKIGDEAFIYRNGLTDVIIPDSVTDIGDRAFEGCVILTGLVIPDRVKNIGVGAFARVRSLTLSPKHPYFQLGQSGELIEKRTGKLLYCPPLVQTCSISAGVKVIGERAFERCTRLTEVTIPDGVTTIEAEAFFRCSELTSAIIPDSVTAIEKSAFASCVQLADLIIPDNVKRIGYRAFAGVRNVSLSPKHPCFQLGPNGELIEKRTGKLLYCPPFVQTCLIPAEVKIIGTGAFDNCHSLTEVVIPNGVRTIESWAFDECPKLFSIVIPDSITNVEEDAFVDCNELDTVSVPSTANIDWHDVFAYCPKADIFLRETH